MDECANESVTIKYMKEHPQYITMGNRTFDLRQLMNPDEESTVVLDGKTYKIYQAPQWFNMGNRYGEIRGSLRGGHGNKWSYQNFIDARKEIDDMINTIKKSQSCHAKTIKEAPELNSHGYAELLKAYNNGKSKGQMANGILAATNAVQVSDLGQPISVEFSWHIKGEFRVNTEQKSKRGYLVYQDREYRDGNGQKKNLRIENRMDFYENGGYKGSGNMKLLSIFDVTNERNKELHAKLAAINPSVPEELFE